MLPPLPPVIPLDRAFGWYNQYFWLNIRVPQQFLEKILRLICSYTLMTGTLTSLTYYKYLPPTSLALPDPEAHVQVIPLCRIQLPIQHIPAITYSYGSQHSRRYHE